MPVSCTRRIFSRRGGTRHIRVVDTEQGGLVTRHRVESNARAEATRAKEQDKVRAIVSDGAPVRHADVAAIFRDDPLHIVADGHAPGNQLGDARGTLGSCSPGNVSPIAKF